MAVKARAEITLSSIRDIQSVTRYYLLQSSTAAKPDKPTTNPPGGSWVKAEPTYTTGSTNSLYFTDCTVFSDGTFVYSDVSLSSSYEAAKVAYNKAENAETIAEKAKHAINLTPFGSRKLTDSSYWLDGLYRGVSSGVVHTAEQLEDGWIHVTIDPTGYTGTKQYVDDTVRVAVSPSVKAGGLYTIFYEVRNNKSTVVDNNTNSCFYIQQVSSCQFWGQSFVESLEGKATAMLRLRDAITTNGVYRHRFTQLADSGTHAGSNPTALFRMMFRADVRDVLDYEVRVSLYEDRYLGDYMPYVVSDTTGLESDIAAAQATANGKNTVYYQASAPSGGTYKTNDIWFDTNDGNKMYMWNGTTWVAEEFGSAAISDLSITNAKIANGTIESAKIANLDAGKITTGTMSAARIKGGELSLGGENDTDGVMKVYDAEGNLVGSFTKEGLMAIAGMIGGWTIKSGKLMSEWNDGNWINWTSSLEPDFGLTFEQESNEPGLNGAAVSFYNKVNFQTDGTYFSRRRVIGDEIKNASAFITSDVRGDIDTSEYEGTVIISPHLTVDGTGIDSPYAYFDQLHLKTLENGLYIRQPQLIMKGSIVVKNGSTDKNVVLCTIPTAYQDGYYIIPFVSRTYGLTTGVPDDAGDFKYAYYNHVNYTVNLKLFNNLASGVWYEFVYFIYALPKT